jgi:hypothetical protein
MDRLSVAFPAYDGNVMAFCAHRGRVLMGVIRKERSQVVSRRDEMFKLLGPLIRPLQDADACLKNKNSVSVDVGQPYDVKLDAVPLPTLRYLKCFAFIRIHGTSDSRRAVFPLGLRI